MLRGKDRGKFSIKSRSIENLLTHNVDTIDFCHCEERSDVAISRQGDDSITQRLPSQFASAH